MSKGKKYRLVCNDHGHWHIEVMMKNDVNGKIFWSEVKRFENINEAGYYEAKKWMEENL